MEIINGADLNKDIGVSFLLYAPPKVGKTTILGKLPGKTLVIDTDKGAIVLAGNKNIDIVRIRSLEELTEVYNSLKKGHKYDNICIDTLTEIRESFLGNAAKTSKTKEGKDMGTPQLNDYGKVKYTLVNILRDYKALTDDNVNVGFTAWEISHELTDPEGNKTTFQIPQVGGAKGDDANTICGLVDIVGRVKVDSDNERYIQLAPIDGDCIAGDRLFGRSNARAEDLLTGLKPKPETKKEGK
jgi:phage nucleotide-binding protein